MLFLLSSGLYRRLRNSTESCIHGMLAGFTADRELVFLPHPAPKVGMPILALPNYSLVILLYFLLVTRSM